MKKQTTMTLGARVGTQWLGGPEFSSHPPPTRVQIPSTQGHWAHLWHTDIHAERTPIRIKNKIY